MAALSAIGLFACSSSSSPGGSGGSKGGGGTIGTGSGGTHGTGTAGATGSGGTGTGTGTAGTTGSGTGTGGSSSGGSGTGTAGSSSGGSGTGTGGSSSGGSGTGTAGSSSGGSGTGTGGSSAGGSGAGGSSGCTNTSQDTINEDASGYVCNNKWGIKGAWYCYSDGSDTSSGNSCKGSDGKGAGAIPWNATANAMCFSGTMSAGTANKYAGIGFKVNSGPPGSTAAAGTWDASNIVGFAITFAPGASGKGSGGMVLNLEYPTPNDLGDPKGTMDAPGVTLPGVGTTGMVTYNVLFSDAVLANDPMHRTSVDSKNLSDVKIALLPDAAAHSYDFCIKSVVPLMTAPNPLVATGAYGPPWNNQLSQTVGGVNGYAIQSDPFDSTNGLPMTMQVMATSGGVGFTYTAKSGASGNTPAAFPAITSGWGPGMAGIQLYGPYQGDKTISSLQSVKSSWSFSMGGSGDAAYDVWFGPSAAPKTKPAIELMIWIGNTGKNPLGSMAGAAVMGSDGVARTPYTADNNGTGQKVVSYVPSSSGTGVTNFDLLTYFKDAATHGYAGLSSGSYLLGVQTGFEVYSADTWKTTDYNIDIK